MIGLTGLCLIPAAETLCATALQPLSTSAFLTCAGRGWCGGERFQVGLWREQLEEGEASCS